MVQLDVIKFCIDYGKFNVLNALDFEVKLVQREECVYLTIF